MGNEVNFMTNITNLVYYNLKLLFLRIQDNIDYPSWNSTYIPRPRNHEHTETNSTRVSNIIRNDEMEWVYNKYGIPQIRKH